MNRLIQIIYVIIFSIATSFSQTEIPFDGNVVIVKGWAKNLAIVGSTKNIVKVKEAQQTEESAFEYQISNDSIYISLLSTCNTISIVVPKSINLKVEMNDVVYETIFDRHKSSDWRALAITKIDGDVESSTDGYNVALDKVKGSISVVTYGNISAILPDLSNCELVSLDTYWGNVYAKIPQDQSSTISLTAKSGKVDIQPNIKFQKTTKKTKRKFKGQMKDGLLPIILHSEGGDRVTLEAN